MIYPSTLPEIPPNFPLSSGWRPIPLSQSADCAVPDQAELDRLSGILDPVDPLEVVHVFGPWVEYLYQNHQPWRHDQPLFVGLTGSVCSGKTTAARVLHHLFAQRYGEQKTALLTLDNFLKPNAQIAQCPGGMASKGFPQTFRFDLLLDVLNNMTQGRAVDIPCYDHVHYDIFEGRSRQIPARQQVVIVEGIIAAQNSPIQTQHPLQHIRDYCNTMVFVQTVDDARVLPQWFEQRLLLFANTVLEQRSGHLALRYADQLKQFDQDLSQGLSLTRAKQRFEQAIRLDAHRIWTQTNGPNYANFIEPSKRYCDTVLLKTADHRVGGVYRRC